MEKLEYLSAAQIGRLINGKELSPTEAVKYFAKRIEERNGSINAFVYTKIDEALKDAKIIEKRLSDGEIIGPFAGVPFALKDFLPAKKGWQNSHGGVRALIKPDCADSEFCAAMEKAGGIAIGKTNAPAFGFRGTCDNLLYGATSTPFNTEYNSGGSSGGSAAAVADGLVPIAEGSDGGGSIRIPAAWCSCFGFKPSAGVVPSVNRPDAWAATHPYCANGAITKTVEDSAIILSLMARFDGRDPFSVRPGDYDYVSQMNRSLKGVKIGLTLDFGIFPVEDEIKRIILDAAKQFESAGAQLVPVQFNIPYTATELAEMWCKSICIDTAIELENDRKAGFDLVKDHADCLPDEFIYWNEQTAKSGISDYYALNRLRTDLLDAFSCALEKCDIILSPTTCCLPVKNSKSGNTKGPESICGVKSEPLIGFCQTHPLNFIGFPAASVPAGLSKSGLPVGMQIIAGRYNDGLVLAAARTFEQIKPWQKYYDIPFLRKI